MLYKYGLTIEPILNGISFKSGSCRLCHPCAAKLKKPCKKPKKMRYSLESVGVDVASLASKLDHEILWYKNKKLPKYVSVVGGVLTNKKVPEKNLNFHHH